MVEAFLHYSYNLSICYKFCIVQQGNMQRNSDGSQRRHGGADVDPYSGLMSTREKQWLMNIQMMQLNTGTPYIDDYYYTVKIIHLFYKYI